MPEMPWERVFSEEAANLTVLSSRYHYGRSKCWVRERSCCDTTICETAGHDLKWTKYPAVWNLNNFTVYTSSVNSSTKYFLGSLGICLIEDFSRNSVNISDCRAFTLFETVTGSRIKTNEPWFYGMHKLAEFVHYKSIIIFRIAWLFQTNIASSH